MRHPKAIQTKSRLHEVKQLGPESFEVTSGASGKQYTVTLMETGATCSCEWAKYRPSENNGQSGCSHVVAVYQWTEKNRGAQSVSAWADLEEAGRQHRKVLDIGDGLLLTVRKA